MQTTTTNDSMMSDFFQVNGYTNMDGGLIPITKVEMTNKEKLRQIEAEIFKKAKNKKITQVEAERIKKFKENQDLEKDGVYLFQDIPTDFGNSLSPIPTQSTDNNNQKTNYLLIGIGAILLVGVTTLIVKKS